MHDSTISDGKVWLGVLFSVWGNSIIESDLRFENERMRNLQDEKRML